MNADILKKAGIDYDGGVKRLMGKAKLYEKLLSMFLNDGTFARIQADHAENNVEKLQSDAHEFKGMCGNIALTRLHELSGDIVAILRGDAYSKAELTAAYTLLEREYFITKEAVKTAMEG